MAYFPLCINLEEQPCLLFGAGSVGLHKARILLTFDVELCVVADKFLPEFDTLSPYRKIEKKLSVPTDAWWLEQHILDSKIVICALNDEALDSFISGICSKHKIPCNVPDCPSLSTFYFPAVIASGDLCVAVSTGGASPAAASWLKQELSGRIPSDFPEILNELKNLRPVVMESVKEPEARKKAFRDLLEWSLTQNELPSLSMFDTWKNEHVLRK